MSKRKILVVSDETIVAQELGERLVALGYEVAIAGSQDESRAMMAASEPDLVLMDNELRGDLRAREAPDSHLRFRSIAVVLMTTEGAPSSPSDAGVIEPHGHLVKPFTQRELCMTLELALCKVDAAREARAIEDRFFAVSIDMLCCLDFNGYFKRLNPAWEQTLGFTQAELMSHPFIEFVHPDDRERTLKQNAAVRAGGNALAFENRYLCKDGSFRWFHWNAAPDSGELVIYSVARDVTARKQADEEREQLVRELQSALAEVRTLREILPICSYCRKIRDDENYWHTVESYFSVHTKTLFSHGICPSCAATVLEPEMETT